MNKLLATLAAASTILALSGCQASHHATQPASDSSTTTPHQMTISQAQFEWNAWEDDPTATSITIIMTTDNADPHAARSDVPNTFVDAQGQPGGWVTTCLTTFYGEPILDHGIAQCDVDL